MRTVSGGKVGGSRRWLAAWLLFAGIAAAAILYFALVFVPGERAAAIELWRGRLSAMADDRKAAITAWLNDRLGHARVIAEDPIVTSLLDSQGTTPIPLAGAETPQHHVLPLVESIRGAFGYTAVYVVDSKGGLVLRSSGAPSLEAGYLASAERVLGSGSASVDVHAHEGGSPIVIFGVPVRANGRVLGAVLLAQDPALWLYPLLRSEPIPSSSAESLLGRQVGDEIEYLSPLRHRPGPPLSFRVPVSGAPLAVVAAICGEEGFKDYPDYRGVPVLGAPRHVPGTDWGLVVKVDRAEALAGFGRNVRQGATAIAGLLIAVAGLGFGAQRALAERHRRELGESEARFALLRDHANDAILISSRTGVILDANRKAEEMYGRSRQELIGTEVVGLRAPEERAAFQEQLDAIARGERTVFETVHVRSNGEPFPVEVSKRLVTIGGQEAFLAINRDITERKRAEVRITQLNRLLRTISEINQLVVRERDRDRLLAEACRIVVEHGGFRMAWIGFVDEASGTVSPAASAGRDEGYTESMEIKVDSTPFGSGPTGTAIREGRTVIANDWETDERVAPWREMGRSRGYRSSAAFALTVGGKVDGAFMVYSSAPNAFDSESTSLFEELAGDIGFALDSMATEARRLGAERALAESERRFRSMFERTPLGYQSLDGEGRFLDVNPAWLEMLGYGREDVIGRWFGDFLAPEHVERFSAAFPRFRAAGEIHGIEFEMVRKDGSRIIASFDGRIGYDENGQFKQTHCLLADISERKRGELLANRERAFSQAALDSLPGLFYLFDDQGRFLRWNRNLERVSGYSAAEIGRMIPTDFFGDDAKGTVAGAVEQVLRAGSATVAADFMSKDGSRTPYLFSGTRFLFDERPCVIGMGVDITERKKIEEQLRHSQKMEAVGQLAGGVAHDFNNLLQAMLSLTQMLVGHLSDPKRLKSDAAELEQLVKRGAALTRQLLLFSRRETLRSERLDLNEVVRDGLTLLRRLLKAHVAIEAPLAEGQLPVEADRGQLGQVLINLGVNAGDAMPEGGRLVIATGSENGTVWVKITDTGGGIPAAIRDHIFEPFFTTKGPGKGTGLGLSVVHGIVTQHGGTVTFESREGQGTTFAVTLPRAGSGESPAVEIAERGGASPRGHGELVLVVEDEESARQALAEILTILGYQVTAVGSGEEAGRLAPERPFDLLLTDLMLPGITGGELAMGLQARWPDLRVVLMSGYTEDEAVRRGVGEGQVRFLQKPFDMDALARELRAALDTA